jgi:maltose/moltooligosaccharide transporter
VRNSDKPLLPLWSIIQMNIGFLGLQFSFGLQQANMTPIFSYLGAEKSEIPLLWLAGPMTGLIVQPIIGALSDRTISRYGRRTPYFLIGAVFAGLGLFFMPFSWEVWMAVSLLWILDAANNVTMEPYRAYVSDRLREEQRTTGYLTQSAFTGLAQTLAYLSPTILVAMGLSRTATGANAIPDAVFWAFMIGAVLSVTTIFWSVFSVRELPLTDAEVAHIKSKPGGVSQMFKDIGSALRDMPSTMRQLTVMKLFQWYAMACYWQFIVLVIAQSVFGTGDTKSQGFTDANFLNGQVGGFYNFVAFLSAFAMIPLSKRFGAKWVHAVCLTAAGLAMLWIPHIHDKALLFVAVIGIGLAWGSIMGNPYIMLANSIPPERTGVYMGIFNMFIVIPMLIQGATMGWIMKNWLGNDPGKVLMVAGVLMLCAAVAASLVKVQKATSVLDEPANVPGA